MVKLNLIIDGNYLLQKNISSLWKNKLLYSELYNTLERDFHVLTHLFNFKKIYFVSDSSNNWRKDYYPEHKGTRKKDDVDWKFIYEQYEELKLSITGKSKVELVKVDRMEGDDLVGFILNNLNKKNESTFLVTSDSDLYQLISYDNLDLKYINIMYNYKFNDEKLFVPEGYNFFINNIINKFEDDIFQTNNEMEFIEFFEKISKGKRIVEVNSEFELFKKVMGHGKDNIKSVFMQGNRGIGEAGIETVYTLYKQTYPGTIDFNSDIFQDNLIEIIKFHKKVVDNSFDESIKERLKRNLKIVKLDEESTPPNLYENMKKSINI